MAEYIEREELLRKIRWADDPEDCIMSVKRMPAAEVTRAVHGTWGKDRDFIKCSACGYGMYPNYCRFMNGVCVGVGYNEPNYCPNCGAKMEGEHND